MLVRWFPFEQLEHKKIKDLKWARGVNWWTIPILPREDTWREPRLAACRILCRYMELWPCCRLKSCTNCRLGYTFQFTHLRRNSVLLHLVLKHPCDLHGNSFSCRIHPQCSASRAVGCSEPKEHVISISACLTDFFPCRAFFAWRNFAFAYLCLGQKLFICGSWAMGW